MPYPYRTNGEPGRDGKPALPCALYARDVENLACTNLRLRWDNELAKVWRDGLFVERAKDVTVSGCALSQPHPGDGAAVRCRDTEDLLATGCQALPGTHIFLDASGASAGAARLLANDFSRAERPYATNGPVQEAGNLTERPLPESR